MKNSILPVLIFILVLAGGVFIWQYAALKKAHASFDNYYAFRGCRELLKKTDSWGTCKTDKGQTIKMVKYRGKWYLDGDLPVCAGNFCL